MLRNDKVCRVDRVSFCARDAAGYLDVCTIVLVAKYLPGKVVVRSKLAHGGWDGSIQAVTNQEEDLARPLCFLVLEKTTRRQIPSIYCVNGHQLGACALVLTEFVDTEDIVFNGTNENPRSMVNTGCR